MHNLIFDYLAKLGFDKDAAKIFLALTQFGPLTLLETSRKSGVERTKLYRLGRELAAKGLVEEVPEHKRTTLKAIDTATLQRLVRQKEADTNFLTSSFPLFSQTLESLKTASPGSSVVYYQGKEGMKQLVWHMLRAKDMPFRTYSIAFWSDLFGDKFSLDLCQELNERKFKVHDLYSDAYIKYKEQWYEKHGQPPGDWTFWHSRYISEKILKIQVNMDFYDDVVAYYYWQDSKLFGVEITDEKVALLHKQVFDVLWKFGKPLGHFDWRHPEKTWKKRI